MTLQPFAGFETYSTHHCVTGSLKHIYDSHGYPISEDLLLGLGEGIGFVYFHIKGVDPFYGGRGNVARPGTEGLEKTIGRRTGVVVESHTTSSTRKAQQTLRELLDVAEPVLVYLDMGFLPYFDLPDDYHFGGHVVVVAGHDPNEGLVLIADRDEQLHPVEWEVLEEARGSKHKPFPPQHMWYTFDFEPAHPPTSGEVWEAIGGACDAMLRPPIANLGVKGIRKAITETLKWPQVLNQEALRRTCFNVAMFIDHRGGTGGGIFRYMYARFLKEAATITAEPRLADLSAKLTTIGDRWEDVATVFSQAAEATEPADLLDDATTPMNEIADLEQEFWETLATTVTG
ncbi:MAG: BtrH N-terminal domain-containing protein [Acidimicrobiia bacterium]|nr:BtrH N-terminal domain-containing protein [Acidimicrobiia bacterium]